MASTTMGYSKRRASTIYFNCSCRRYNFCDLVGGFTEVARKSMIHVNGIYKSYGKKQILKGVSFHVKRGEVFGLIGPNGAGKSTLLSILATITKPSSGTISFQEMNVLKNSKAVKSMIGYVPQDIGLWEDLTVEENMIFWSKFSEQPVEKEHLFALCQKVRLEEKWYEKVANLSGGMKRKLNIAVSLIHNPEILLMDEPTVGIDLESKLEINKYIQDLAKQGKTVLYTTHDLREIMHLCDRIGVLNNGEITFVGTIDEAKEMMVKELRTPPKNEEQLLLFLLAMKSKVKR